MADEIIKELWKIKDNIAKEYNYDLRALAVYLKNKKHEGDHQTIDRRADKKTTEQNFGLDRS